MSKTESGTPPVQNEEIKKGDAVLERSFYGKVAIVGPTGTGKSYLAKTANRDTTGYINMERKPLPFKDQNGFKFMGMPKNWASFKANLEQFGANPLIKQIIIDSQTMAFNVLNKEMSINFSGYDIYRNYNRQVYEYLEILKNIEKDIIVLSHDEWLKVEGEGKKRMMSVHGKEFEGKIEQHFSIVMYTATRLKDGKAQYFLKTYEQDTSTKVPEGMFPNSAKDESNLLEIPNDAEYIFDALKNYYSIVK